MNADNVEVMRTETKSKQEEFEDGFTAASPGQYLQGRPEVPKTRHRKIHEYKVRKAYP